MGSSFGKMIDDYEQAREAEKSKGLKPPQASNIHDPYPPICEFCPSTRETHDEAYRTGWKLGWDGWICDRCHK